MNNTQQYHTLDFAQYTDLIDHALSEDLGGQIDLQNDITSFWTLESDTRGRAKVVARTAGVIAGLALARATFTRLDSQIECTATIQDGQSVEVGHVILHIEGPARVLLCGERTALNFLQRLSGIATQTRRFVNAIAGTTARITDTRKTTPGWRHLQKWAVIQGGGVNHRIGLHDAVLIKENHAAACGGVAEAVKRVRAATAQREKHPPIFVEAENMQEVMSLSALEPDRIMLDNMSNDLLRQSVEYIRANNPSIVIEATGGYTLETVLTAAHTGVDLISIGSLTHSAPALDLSMLFD
tara:strand:+ start:5773 stop:6663 length:891 start_codon:yes stop_codon:yes gene_type:complete